MKSAYDSTLRRILYAKTWQSIKYRLMRLFHAQTRNGAMYEAKFGRDGAMYEFLKIHNIHSAIEKDLSPKIGAM